MIMYTAMYITRLVYIVVSRAAEVQARESVIGAGSHFMWKCLVRSGERGIVKGLNLLTTLKIWSIRIFGGVHYITKSLN
jgi:hypothetical protein